MPKLEVVSSSYQQASKVLFTFVPNKQFGPLLIYHLIHEQC